jgi:hypothetical protein
MKCAFCQHELRAGEPMCPACGRPTRDAEAPAEVRIVEGSIEPSGEVQLAYMPSRAVPASGENRALVPTAPVQSALAALAHLPRLAWQQPVVRSAVTTGASAVALTVALRLAGRLVASQGGRRAASRVASDTLLPALAEMLQRGAREPITVRRGRAGEVTETFIYMRRTYRP